MITVPHCEHGKQSQIQDLLINKTFEEFERGQRNH